METHNLKFSGAQPRSRHIRKRRSRRHRQPGSRNPGGSHPGCSPGTGLERASECARRSIVEGEKGLGAAALGGVAIGLSPDFDATLSDPELLHKDLAKQSLYELLEREHGITIVTASRSGRATLASSSTAKALSIREGAAVLVLRSTLFADDGRPVEHFASYYPGQKSLFEVTLRRLSNSTGTADGITLTAG